jgi:hypothetical protein
MYSSKLTENLIQMSLLHAYKDIIGRGSAFVEEQQTKLRLDVPVLKQTVPGHIYSTAAFFL